MHYTESLLQYDSREKQQRKSRSSRLQKKDVLEHPVTTGQIDKSKRRQQIKQLIACLCGMPT